MKAIAIFLVLAACRMTDDAAPDPKPAASTAAVATAAPMKASGIELVTAPAGDVHAVVAAAKKQARERGRTLLVYIGARWCEPCQRFHHAAELGELDAKFPKLTLLVFDADDDGERLHRSQYAPGYLPYFAMPGDDGKPTRHSMEGSIKGDGAVANIAPRLERLIDEN